MAKRKSPRNRQGKFIKQGNLVSDDIFIPNHSGTHDAGIIHKTPINDFDIPNKKYVDDAVAGGGGGGITNLEGGSSDENFGGVAISPIDGGNST